MGDRIQDLTAITAAQITNDTQILFGADNTGGDASRYVSLAELKKTAQIRTVATVAAMQALTDCKDDQLFQTLGYSTEGVGANLYRYDASSSATADGGFVITATGMGAGRFIAVDQTVADVTKFGAVPRRVSPSFDSTTFIQQAIDTAETISGGIQVYIPAGEYIVTSGITVHATGVEVVGENHLSTQLRYTPATGDVITFGNSVSSITFTGLKNISILCVDTTNTKRAVVLNAVRSGQFSDILIRTCHGGDSVGIHVLGHDNITFRRLEIDATVPIRISKNAVTTSPVIDVDHFRFTDCYFKMVNAPAPSTLERAHVLVDSDVYISNLLFDGRQPWAGGRHGFHYNRTDTTSPVSHNVSLHNVRLEQRSDATGYAFYHAAPNGFLTLDVSLQNCRADAGGRGYFFNRARTVNLRGLTHSGTANSLEFDICYSLVLNDFFTSGGIAAILPGATMRQISGNKATPSLTYWQNAEWIFTSGLLFTGLRSQSFPTGSGATPSVSGVNVIQINNAAPETLTTFSGGESNQIITVHITEANTGITGGSGITLGAAGNYAAQAGGALFTFYTPDGTNWYEISRSVF